jgi:hypothetical protein
LAGTRVRLVDLSAPGRLDSVQHHRTTGASHGTPRTPTRPRSASSCCRAT